MNPIFVEAKSDYYMRTYEVNPTLFGRTVTLYMECTENKERINGHQYWLDIYFSVDHYPIRNFVIGVSFGEEPLEKDELDMELDTWAAETLMNDFSPHIYTYLQKEELWIREVEKQMKELDGPEDNGEG